MSRPDESSTIAQTGRTALGLLARAAVVAALVLGSGAVRWWQARRVEATMVAALNERRFKLNEIPMTLGDWAGVKTEMDERIVAATGGDELITRHYVDARTGVGIDMIVLFGPSSDIFIHTPELCYPKAGFGLHAGAIDRPVGPGDGATFRSVAYAKGDAAARDIQDVYYSWRLNGRWTPSVGGRKQLERAPGMYKVQVSRRLSPREARGDDRDPCESFLRVLIPDLESRITGGAPSPKATPKP